MKTVVRLGNENRHSRPMSRDRYARLHPQRSREHLKVIRLALGDARSAERHPLDALKKYPGFHVAVLVGMENVPTPRKDPTRHARHEPGLIRAVQQGDERGGCFRHESATMQESRALVTFALSPATRWRPSHLVRQPAISALSVVSHAQCCIFYTQLSVYAFYQKQTTIGRFVDLHLSPSCLP